MRRLTGAVGSQRRVVITGMGVVSPLGNTLEDSWKRVIGIDGDKNSGITTLEEALLSHQDLTPDQFDREWKIARSLPCQVAAPVRGLAGALLQEDASARMVDGGGSDVSRWNPRTTARFVQMALLAGSQAMRHANLANWLNEEQDEGVQKRELRRDRIGVCVGSGMSSVREVGNAWETIAGGKIRKLSPHFIPKVLSNSASGRLSLEFGLRGPNLAPSTACAASAHAIGDAVRTIRSGAADLMLAGGSEASIEPLGLAGFCRLRALSTLFNETPEQSSRPFDSKRDGFVMGEGAAVLVLEELEHAKERIRQGGNNDREKVKILAEVTGYAATGDAFHVTAPDEAGLGAERAMLLALEEDRRQFPPVPIGYVNAHATSTPKGDQIEAVAVDRVLQSYQIEGNNSSNCYMSSTKGISGHLLGAAGALEAAFTIMSLGHQKIPPTMNLSQPDENNEIYGDTSYRPLFSHVTGERALQPSSDVKLAISNSFGFGGTNSSLIFRKYNGVGAWEEN